jgi:hypothetical protein
MNMLEGMGVKKLQILYLSILERYCTGLFSYIIMYRVFVYIIVYKLYLSVLDLYGNIFVSSSVQRNFSYLKLDTN